MSTSFPGSLLFTPQEAREGRPWLGLVTCLPKSGRLQISDWREGRLSVSLPILSVPGMGKHAPVRINLQNGTCQVVQKPASETVNVGCCRLYKSVGAGAHQSWLEILAKSLQQSRNWLLLAEAEELLYGDALPLCEFLPHLLCRPRQVVRSTISESQVSFELKVKRCIERGVVLRPAYANKFEGQERIKRDRKCVWKPQSLRTKFRINAIINSNKGHFFLHCNDFFERVFFAHWMICEKFAL